VASLPGGDFNTGDTEYIVVAAQFHSAIDRIVVGDGDPDTELAGPLDNGIHRVRTIRKTGMKMKIYDCKAVFERCQIGGIKLNSIKVIHGS